MGTKLPTLIALDTNFVLDLANGEPDHSKCMHALGEVCIPKFILPNTANEELGRLSVLGKDAQTRRMATVAAQRLSEWKITPYPLPGVKAGIVETIADEIRKQGLIPDEERNDSLIVAEAAYLECKLLISSDRHITGIDRKKLHAILASRDVTCVEIAFPKLIISKFGKG